MFSVQERRRDRSQISTGTKQQFYKSTYIRIRHFFNFEAQTKLARLCTYNWKEVHFLKDPAYVCRSGIANSGTEPWVVTHMGDYFNKADTWDRQLPIKTKCHLCPSNRYLINRWIMHLCKQGNQNGPKSMALASVDMARLTCFMVKKNC
jgi:hypothetical protein